MSKDECFAEALKCEEISRVSGRSGDFRTSRYFHKEAEWFLGEAAQLEKEERRN